MRSSKGNSADGGQPSLRVVAGNPNGGDELVQEALEDVMERLTFWIPQLPDDSPERRAFLRARRGLALALGRALLAGVQS